VLTSPRDGATTFYANLPVFDRFEDISDLSYYRPVPDDWLIALTDIVGSTAAVAAGRYKAVNMAGAALIAAFQNARGADDLPFVFGGDGAMVAVPGSFRAKAEAVVATVQAWVKAELGLDMRGALVPVADIREAGRDVLVARFGPSDQVTYAMFAGGGSHFAETAMKAGRYAVRPATDGSKPDLTGLSCRWSPVRAANGEILSIIATPEEGADPGRFDALVAGIVAIAGETAGNGNPIHVDRMRLGYPATAVGLEVRTARPGERLSLWLKVQFEVLVVLILSVLPGKIGWFELAPYKQDVMANSDFRKFDDGLKMTIDVEPARAERIEALLERARADGICRYGIQRQTESLITCLVVSPRQRNHMHFIDGAAGGYAMAASRLKARTEA
jgi:hypothetical protein